MPRRAENLFSTSRGRIRSSMNRFNLFNLYKKPAINYNGKTLFQQKWAAKQETRAYHGEHLTEGRWKTLFNPNLESVAQLDASLKGVNVAPTPMPLQSYATLEKRLEVALFRAMFSSSVRQARQFILGGHVKVNDVVVKHPSFPLKSGDIFSVTPDRVLLAMGRVKPSLERAIKVDNKQIAVWNKYVKAAKANPRDVWELKNTKPKSLNTMDSGDSKKDNIKKFNEKIDQYMITTQKSTNREVILSRILSLGLSAKPEDLGPKIFQEFGDKDSVKSFKVYQKLSDANHSLLENNSVESSKDFITKKSPEFESSEEARLATSVKQLLNELVKSRHEYIRRSAEESKLSETAVSVPFGPQFSEKLQYHPKLDKEKILEDETSAKVDLPWQKGLFGRAEPLKSYFTPWTPRPFIGCFAILPSHIEISFSTCHAIYLRDPVARPGHSEVITPFPDHVHERAYMYYARNGM